MRLKVKHSTRKEVLQAYGADASLFFSMPSIVIWPKNKDELVEAVEYCIEEQLSITPRGGGTCLTGGAVPSEGAAVIDTNSIRHTLIEEKVFGAGIRIKEMNEMLKKAYCEILPVIPSTEAVCTLGGAIATNAGGLCSFKYGRMDRWIEEVKFVDGKGKIRKGKEIIGSEGIFGIVYEAKVKTKKEESTRSIDLFLYDETKDVVKKVEEMSKEENVTMIEYLSKTSAQYAGLGEKHVLIIGYNNEKGKYRDKEAEKIIAIRKGMHALVVEHGFIFTEDPYVPLEQMEHLLSFLASNNIPAFGHIAAGVLHPTFSAEHTKIKEKMYELVMELGGDVSGEHGYGVKKWKYLPEEKKKRLKELKKKYDPKNLFNPGKVIEGNEALLMKQIKHERCTFCGLCNQCPVFLATRKECHSPRVKINFKNFAYACSLCKLCQQLCPLNVEVSEEIIKIRYQMIKRGVETESNKKMIENVRKFKNPFGESFSEGEWYCC